MIHNTTEIDPPAVMTAVKPEVTSASNGHSNNQTLAPASVDTSPPRLRATFRIKYVLERIVSSVMLVLFAPVIALLCVVVRLTSPGPAIYSQTRVGMGGKTFRMFKIRSMVVDAEAKSGPAWSTPSDPRITPIGRILRFLHLDELPQLWNVVKGDMSVIGPRPERPDIVDVLSDSIDGYTDRLNIKPGITGLAQIYLPPDETLNCVRKKLCYDRAYIDTATLWIDAKIWLCTVLRMVGVRKGRGPRWTGLDRQYKEVKAQCERITRPMDDQDGFSFTHAPEQRLSRPNLAKARSTFGDWTKEDSNPGRICAK